MLVDCHMKTLQSLREQIHSYVAVCQTVDVYLDSLMPAVCFCDSNVCFKSRGKSEDVHTRSCVVKK